MVSGRAFRLNWALRPVRRRRCWAGAGAASGAAAGAPCPASRLLNPVRSAAARVTSGAGRLRVAALLPGGKLGSTRAGTRVVNAEGRVYYLRIHESIDAGQPVPLAYVRPRLRRGILERRRADFLAAERDRLYREARGRDAIKTYIGNDDS